MRLLRFGPGLLVALAAAAVTAHGLVEVVVAAHVPDGPLAWCYPVMTDGLAGTAYSATGRLPEGEARYAWSVVILAAGVSGLAQAAYLASGALPEAPAWLRFGIGAWPAIAAAVTAHLLYLLAKAVRPAPAGLDVGAGAGAGYTGSRPGPVAPEARTGAGPQPIGRSAAPLTTGPAPTTPTEQIFPAAPGHPIETAPDQPTEQAPGHGQLGEQFTDLPVPPRAPSARPDGDAGAGQDRPTAPARPPRAGSWAGPTPPGPVLASAASTTSPSSTASESASTPAVGPAVRPVPGHLPAPGPGTGRTPTARSIVRSEAPSAAASADAAAAVAAVAGGEELPERARELLAPGRAVAAELADAGEPLTHARLVAGIRGRGHTCSTGTGQSLLAALRRDHDGGQPAHQLAARGPERSSTEQLRIPEHSSEHSSERDIEQETDHATGSTPHPVDVDVDVDERRGARAGAA